MIAKLSPEQHQQVNTLFKFSNSMVDKNMLQQGIAAYEGNIPCPKKVVHAVYTVKLMLETGVLDPTGHAATSLYGVMAYLEKHPAIKEMAKKCQVCSG